MAVSQLSAEEVAALPPVVSLATAARALGFGATKAADLYQAGDFPCPVLKLGRSYKVRKADLLTVLKMNADGTYQTGTDAA